MADTVYVPDTNALLNSPDLLVENECVVLYTVMRELTHLERKKDYATLQYKLRQAKRALRKGIDMGMTRIKISSSRSFAKDAMDNNDDIILHEFEELARENPNEVYELVTDDILMTAKADSRDIPNKSVYRLNEVNEGNVEGVYEFMYNPTNEEDKELLAKIETATNSKLEMYYNPFNLKRNQYLVVWDATTEQTGKDGVSLYDEVGTYRFDGNKLVRLKFKNISNKFEKLKPINVRQRFAFDLIQDRTVPVKLLTGTFGTG